MEFNQADNHNVVSGNTLPLATLIKKKKTFFTERLVKLLNALNRRKLADSLAKCYNKVMINDSIDFMNQKKDCSSTF